MRSECCYFSLFFSYRFILIYQYKDFLLFNGNGASLRFKGDNKLKNYMNDNYIYTPVDILYNHFI